MVLLKEEEKNKSGILFDSNFHLELMNEEEKKQNLIPIISQRLNCFKILKGLIDESFTERT